uniref:Helix-turn-helix transcriptional regulator n=1 Tax=Phenylobacterium glaciei TaxID=2803784 RepID=A0A974SAL7_9CAUL|nr:helix-turn-helix transcriptional regulator [Phenylobacterium glaciei]
MATRLESGGLEELSFAEIAAEAKVGERTVYRHFPTREALMGAFGPGCRPRRSPAQAVAHPGPRRHHRPAR